MLVCAMGAVQAQSKSRAGFYYARYCNLIQIGEAGNGGATHWEKTGQDTAVVGNVIAERTVSLLFKAYLGLQDYEDNKPKLIQGARWINAPYVANHLIPTNVKGLSIRISGSMNPKEYVRPLQYDQYLTIYSRNSYVNTQGYYHFGGGVVVEVVVTGPVAPGSHIVNDLDPAWSNAKFEVVATQRPEIEAPALGTIMQSNEQDGMSPGLGPQCRSVATYTVKDILTLEGGGGGVPIEAKCTVDARFQGAGFSLPMGDYSVGDFRSDGAVSKEVPFQVSVHTCGAGAKPKIGFNAQYGLIPGVSDVLQLKDHTSVTSAKNLGIILSRQGSDRPLMIGQGGDVGQKYEFDNIPGAGVSENGAAEIKLGARYRRTDQNQQSGVKAGTANSQVNFRIYYD